MQTFFNPYTYQVTGNLLVSSFFKHTSLVCERPNHESIRSIRSSLENNWSFLNGPGVTPSRTNWICLKTWHEIDQDTHFLQGPCTTRIIIASVWIHKNLWLSRVTAPLWAACERLHLQRLTDLQAPIAPPSISQASQAKQRLKVQRSPISRFITTRLVVVAGGSTVAFLSRQLDRKGRSTNPRWSSLH